LTSKGTVSPTGRSRAILIGSLRSIALIVYALAFSELFVRLLCPQPLLPRYVTGTPWGVRGNIPNARYWHHTAEVTVQYRINGQGLRADQDYPLRKTPGTCRIAVFGDSFLMGYELDLRDTFTTRLEQALRNQKCRVEVLNFSVSGFGTAEMLRTYEAFARKFDPDVVMFSWHSSDVDDNVRSGLYQLSDGKLESTNRAYVPGVSTQDFLMRWRLYRLVADNSQLYSLLRERLAGVTKRLLVQLRQERHQENKTAVTSDAETGDEEDAARATQTQENIALSSALVVRAAQEVTADGKDFYIVEIPIRVSRVAFRSSIDVLPPEVRSQINIVSPLAAFSRAARPDLRLFYESGHGHFTPLGAEILANQAASALAGSRGLGACRSGTP
jgi:hypothetical protein